MTDALRIDRDADDPPRVAPAPVAHGRARGAQEFDLLGDAEIEKLPAPEYLVEGLMVCKSKGVVYGPTNLGKSFVVLHLALCVATGTPFLGHKVKAGPALYITSEGDGAFPKRYAAWKSHHGITHVPGFRWLRDSISLSDAKDVDKLLRSLRVKCSPDPRLIVIDTLAGCFGAGEESSATDMGVFLRAMDGLRRATGATVLVVHHTGWHKPTERGSSRIRADVDTTISLKKPGQLTLHCDKQKDDAPFPDIRIALVPCLQSLVVQLVAGKTGGPRPKERLCLEVLRQAGPDGLTYTRWAAQCRKQNVSSSAFNRARDQLLTNDLVVHDDALKVYRVAA